MRLRALACLVTALALLGAAPRPYGGTFALQTATASARAHLLATAAAGDPLEVALDIWLTPRTSDAPLTAYDVDMTKLLHTIIVSDDFATFLHVHPVLGRDGHFRIEQRFPKRGLYHIYADGVPHGLGQQVFRFDLPVAAGGPAPERKLDATGAVVNAGPYTVSLDRTTLDTNGLTMLTVHVREGGKPAANLHPYLGALAHAVFLDASDLTYVHVHPMNLRCRICRGCRACPG